jgi:preprotein translocase subunit SecD
MRKIRIKTPTIKWGEFFNYVFLILLSSLLLLNFLIALPLTEKISDVTAFDLNTVEDMWGQEYVLELESEEPADIRKTENILFKRLNNYGVEEASIYQDGNVLTVRVKTSKPETYVDELVRNPYRYSIVTRKDDVDFEDEENQLAPYLAENYNETQFDSRTFRNIHVTKLPDSSGTDSYFGIAKPWTHKGGEFKKFLQEYEEEYIGVNIDGFVTPIYLSDSSVFAITLNADDQSVQAIDILYNSGRIPTTYEVSNQENIEVSSFDINYIEVTIALFISVIAIYLYVYFMNLYSRYEIARSLFATLLSLATFLAFLKLRSVPVHEFILLIDAVLLILLTNIINHNPESRNNILIGTFTIAIIFNLLGIGYLKILGGDLILISVISFLSVSIGNFYINKIIEFFKK